MIFKKGFTLIELLVVIAIIGILSGLIAIMMNGAVDAANDARRRTDISNLYTSILSSGTLAGSYPNLAADINGTSTPEALQQYINASTNQSPEDPTNKISYFYSSNGADFVVGAVLSNGECFVKSTSQGSFTETDCNKLKTGGIGLVQNFMILNGGGTYNLSWAVPAEYNVSNSTVSTALICLEQSKTDTTVPTENELFTEGKLVAIINGSSTYNYYTSEADYNYYCKAVVYNNTVVSNPGTIGGSVNTATNGFELPSPSDPEEVDGNYAASSPVYSSYAASYSSELPSIAGTTTTGGTQSETFVVNPGRGTDGSGTIALSWTPGSGSTHTIIRRAESTTANPSIAPQRLTDGVEIYNKRNDADGQNATALHSYTDTGLNESKYYCYSAWAYNQTSNIYSAGFVLACSGIPPSEPSGVTMYSSTDNFTLTWSLGSASNTVIRRQVDTPAANQNEGTLVYNNSQTPDPETGKVSITDADTNLAQNTTYCYSLWSYNPNTQTLSKSFISVCGKLNMLGSANSLVFSNVAYNSMVLTWNKAVNSTDTIIVQKAGSIPTSRTDGTQIYSGSAATYLATGLSPNTNYCFAIWGTNGTEYSASPLTGCRSTYDTVCSSGGGLTCTRTFNGNYVIDKFTGSGSYTWTAPAGITSVEYLVIAGGGGGGRGGEGGYVNGGGGGAGGFLTGTTSVTSGQSITVNVGAGGSAGPWQSARGSNGGNSSFSTITSIGGGGGGGGYSTASGLAGGSGGGGGVSSAGAGGAGTSGQGNAGGGQIGGCVQNSSTGCGGGGGGGAGGPGGTGGPYPGAAGLGLSSSITGTAVTYAAGGSGARGTTAGPASTGNGGQAGDKDYIGAAGGSGVVIVRYTGN